MIIENFYKAPRLIKVILSAIIIFIITAASQNILANTDNQNATYLAWEDDSGNNQGQVHVFGMIPGTQLRIYDAGTTGTIIQNPVPLMTYTFTVEGEPINWSTRVGAVFGRKFLKFASSYPIIWESGNINPGWDFDYEIGVLSINGTLRGTKFFTYMQPLSTGVAGDVLIVFNPDATAKNVQMARWNGVSMSYVNTVPFVVPAGGVYKFSPIPVTPAGYYRLVSDGNVVVFKGVSDNSDNDNWFEHGSDWISGTKIGTQLYGKFGGSDTKMTITGISAGITSYDVYVMPILPANTSSAVWVLQSSGTVLQGAAVNVNPTQNGGYFKVITNGGEVLVGGGATIMTRKWGDGDYVPGLNTHSPLDSDFYFSTGNNGNGGGGNPVCSVVCPDSGTTVTLLPAGTIMTGINPTTAEDMAITFDNLLPNTTYKVHSNKPIYCFFENGTGSEKAITLSYMSVKRPIMIEKTANVDRTHVGDTITFYMNWKVDASNSLPYQAYAWDTVPAEFTINTVTPAATSQSGNYLWWNLGIKNAGDAGAMTITASVSNSAVEGNTYTNVGMTIMPDTMQVPNQSSVPLLIVPRQLDIIKNASRLTGAQGDAVTYSIFYNNTSGLAITNAVIRDTMPAGLSYVSSNPAGTHNPIDNTVTWTFSSIADAASGTLTVSAIILNTAPIGSVQTNYAYSKADQTKPDFSEADVTIINSPLSLSKTAAPSTALKGDNVTFTLNYQNLTSGGSFAGDQGITVQFMNEGRAVTSTDPEVCYNIINNNNFPIDLANLRIKYYFYNTTLNQDAFLKGVFFQEVCSGPNVNIASVTSGIMGTKQWNLVHTTTFNTCIIAAHDLTTQVKMHFYGNGYPAMDATNDYSFLYSTAYTTNTNIVVEYYINGTWMVIQGQPPGGVTVSNVVLTDPVPACVTYQGTIGAPAGSFSGGNITWNIGTLVPYQSGSVKWYGKTDASCGNTVTNVAQIAATGFGPYSSNMAVVRFLSPPMSITKTASPYLNNIGDTLTYIINFNNNDAVIDRVGTTSGITLRSSSPFTTAGSDYKFNYRLYNNSGAAINLTNFRVVYYFNDNLSNWGGASTTTLQTSMWTGAGVFTFADMVSGCLTGKCWSAKNILTYTSGTPLTNTNYYETQSGMHWSGYAHNFDPTNDWSFLNTGGGGTYALNPKVAVEELVGGVWKLNYGTRPDDPQPLTNIKFWDTIPADLTVLTVNAVGLSVNVTGNLLTSTIASMSGQQAYSITVVAQVKMSAVAGVVTNTAMIQPQTMNAVYDDAPILIIISSPTSTPTATMTSTKTDTSTFTATQTSTPSQTVTNTSTDTSTATYTDTPTVTDTVTNTNTSTNTYTSTATPTMTNTATGTNTSTDTNTSTNTYTSTATPTMTNTATGTNTFTNTYTFTVTYTYTATPTMTNTATGTDTFTNTSTFTSTYTFTASPTMSSTYTQTNTYSSTQTSTNSYTFTATYTYTYTNTVTQTYTYTDTATYTSTFTATPTFTNTPTVTDTPTITPTHPPYPYTLSIEVYNSAGEKVKIIVETLITQEVESVNIIAGGIDGGVFNPSAGPLLVKIPGINTPLQLTGDSSVFTWDGTSDMGQNITSGVYYIKMSVQDTYGHTLSIIKEVTLFQTGESVKLTVFNSAGEIVKVIYSSSMPLKPVALQVEEVSKIGKPGEYVSITYGGANPISWDGKNSDGLTVASGVYELQLEIVNDAGIKYSLAKTITILNNSSTDIFTNEKIYPNPCFITNVSNPVAHIAWTSTNPGIMTIIIYNIQGEFVKTLSAPLLQGFVDWDVRTPDGTAIANGIYIVVLRAKTDAGQISRKIAKLAILKSF